MKFNLKIYIDYFILFSLIAISAFPATVSFRDNFLLILLTFTGFVFIYRKKKIDPFFVKFLVLFIGLTIIHIVKFEVWPYKTIIGLFFKILLGYFTVKVLGVRFIFILVRIMVILTVISFIFWIPATISDNLEKIIESNALFIPQGYADGNYILYHLNFGRSIVNRNSGPFWEPGVFGGFLIIALIFNYLKTPVVKNKTNLILLAGILSTTSTTSYLVLFLFIFIFVLHKLKTQKIILILFFLPPLYYYLFTSLPFLQDKLLYETERIDDSEHYNEHRTRLTSAIIDLKDFTEHPIFGKGKFEGTRFDDDTSIATNRNNGTTDFLVIFGMVGFITYFFYYFKSFNHFMRLIGEKKKYAFFSVIIVLILGFSENYFLLPFFWGLCFFRMPYIVKKNYMS